MARKGQDKSTELVGRKRGRYRAFDGQGVMIWECEDFESGLTKIPFGISVTMRAAQITDGSGEVIHTWDPNKMFGGKS